MSEAEEYDSVRVSAEGVRVLKRFAADEFPVPAIALEISSGRDEQVTLELSDIVPEGVDVDDLGFHPDYGSEYWTIEEGQIFFEREFDANESYTTVYGIRTADDISEFLVEPTVESVDPPLPASDDGGIVLESDDALVEDAIAGGGEVEPDETDETVDETDVPETLDLGGAVSGGESTLTGTTQAVESNGETDPAVESGTRTPPADGDSLVAALAAELRSNDVPEEDLELLGEALVEAHPDLGAGSTLARLNQLQQDVTELRAYTNAMEEFLDENGTGDQVIESFEADLDSFGDRLDHLEAEFVVEVRGRLDDLETEFETLRSEVHSDLERVDSLEEQTEEMAERVDSADARTTELVDQLEEIESELSDLQDWRAQLISTLGG